MTSTQMHTHFKLELDKTSYLDIPSFEDEEIDLWLNKAAFKFVKTRYSGVNPKRTSFEETQKRIDDLRTLIKEETLSGANITVSTNKPNSYLADLTALSETYLFAIGEEVTITFTASSADDILSTSTGTRVGITEVTTNDYRSHIDDPYSEHILHYEGAQPLRLFIGDTVELITDGNYVVTEYHLRYIKEPDTIEKGVTDCDLPDHTHDEIVKIAVDMALENIEQPRYETHINETNTME